MTDKGSVTPDLPEFPRVHAVHHVDSVIVILTYY